MNKIFEVIEAKNIFKIPYNKIEILIHPKSYVHAMIKSSDGLIKIIAHETTMKIPIFNTLGFNYKHKLNSKELNIKKLNKLNLEKVDPKRYPVINLLKLIPNNHSLFETVIVSANDVLVDLFLKKQIKFTDISKNLLKILKDRKLSKFKGIKPKKIDDIILLNSYVRSKINN